MFIHKVSNSLFTSPCTRIALLWEPLGSKKVLCNVCERHCIIPPGKRGFCGARFNKEGTLYVLTYGNISSISNNPMSKKPFNNFHPSEYALTVGSWGCNFLCPWCQNWEISKVWAKTCNYLDPDSYIKEALRLKSSGTSFSFNEPSVTLFEYSLDVMPKAKNVGLFNTYVTNGYMTLDALKLLIKNGLDAANVDIKGCGKKIEKWIGGDVDIVWRNLEFMKKHRVHVEVTTLIVPTVNDDTDCLRSIAKKILDLLGEETPWHITRYYSAYRAQDRGLPLSTPIKTLEKAYKIGKETGLQYVYIGNVPGHKWENTYCPFCNTLLIERSFPWHVGVKIKEPVCPNCKSKLAITL